jgi:deoxyribonucleoside regulator
MSRAASGRDRAELLADVAEMYFVGGLNQSEIGRQVGVTRSMVSRMITEARRSGIVSFHIRRRPRLDRELGERLTQAYDLLEAHVVVVGDESREDLLRQLGIAGARVLSGRLRPRLVLGLAWGTAVRATVQALEVERSLPSCKVVQLIGAFGARIEDYDGHALVRQLETKLGGNGYYINAPFLVDSRDTARGLLANRGIAETMTLAGQCDVALLGVGSIEPTHSSFFRAGYVPLRDLNALRRQGAVGDVCGLHFDSRGRATGSAFSARLVGIYEKALRGIPVRIGVAGGEGKAAPVLGALLGRYINVLVTDEGVAVTLLEEAKKATSRGR